MSQNTSQNTVSERRCLCKLLKGLVGPCGLEPQTSTVSRWRSSQLSYGPTDLFAF
jgi:hypothetical protein